jgi:hypothetical protein
MTELWNLLFRGLSEHVGLLWLAIVTRIVEIFVGCQDATLIVVVEFRAKTGLEMMKTGRIFTFC